MLLLAGLLHAEAQTPTVSQATPTPEVAPHIDLREVAPPPESHDAPASSVGASPTGDAGAPTLSETPDETESQDSLILLGSEVRPGVSTRLTWSPDVAISGLALPTPVLVINGVRRGPVICLTAATHGDELNGIEIIRRVLYDINPDKLNGVLIGVPIVNLQGFQRGSRYLPDRRDLNRYFPGDQAGSLAARIAYSLFHDVLAPCQFLVDIHTGSLRRTNLPQLRADMHIPRVAEFTHGFDAMSVVHSPGSPGMLRVAATQAGMTAVAMEVGESMRINAEAIRAGVRSINSMLQKQGAYARLFSWGEPEPVYYQSRWVRAESGGLLFSVKLLGSRVRAGEVLGTVVDPITNLIDEIVAPMDGRLLGMAIDQVVMPGFAVYHVGAQASEASLSSVDEQSAVEGGAGPSYPDDEEVGDALE